MRYYTSEMLIQVFVIAVILGFTLRELETAGKEIWNIVIESIEMHRLQKRKKPARSLATQRVSKTPIYRG
ncbi:hypothetical protein [Lutispora thermophila]|uniref:Uncharacterized protein n=1 Tax=Lutispora thermophila DSM 19022 TaxID=1122184 RepID=A0A1M6J513_9FIRM|nr:hypothetical protein [Lutispora thermophila]SHJ41732.1 hypothetical protein SAMN02745176_03508 [Lutispora thermophila DSM 19022]